MQQATLVFPIKGRRILLGMKKRGFGEGKLNGFGGKVKYGEEIDEAAIREVWEECGIRLKDIANRGELTFLFPSNPKFNQVVHVFISRDWDGEPSETDEMRPAWFDIYELPFNRMWKDDPHWLPKVIAGERVRGKIIFISDGESIESVDMGSY